MGTISKALRLLNYFSASQPEIGLSELHRLSGQDKATIHRHLAELQSNGFVEQDPVSKAYRLGAAVLRLANVRERTFPARQAIAPIVEEMAEAIGELVHVSLRQGDVLSPIYSADTPRSGITVSLDEAEMLPLHATSSGYALLAFSDAGFVDAYLSKPLEAFTPLTVTDPDALRAILDAARRSGVAECDQGFERDVYTLAVPIFDRYRQATGTAAIAIPTSRATDALRVRAREILKSACLRMSLAIGGDVAPHLQRAWFAAAHQPVMQTASPVSISERMT